MVRSRSVGCRGSGGGSGTEAAEEEETAMAETAGAFRLSTVTQTLTHQIRGKQINYYSVINYVHYCNKLITYITVTN